MYQRIPNSLAIRRTADGAVIPAEPTLGAWQEYQGWLAQGNEPEPAPPALFDRAAAMQRLRDRRAPILNALAGIGFDALAAGDTATAQAVQAARLGLRQITEWQPIVDAVDDEAFDDAALARYRQLALAAPPAVRLAFLSAT
jgi:hypothetical protein